jgi:hypothetical protein
VKVRVVLSNVFDSKRCFVHQFYSTLIISMEEELNLDTLCEGIDDDSATIQSF